MTKVLNSTGSNTDDCSSQRISTISRVTPHFVHCHTLDSIAYNREAAGKVYVCLRLDKKTDEEARTIIKTVN